MNTCEYKKMTRQLDLQNYTKTGMRPEVNYVLGITGEAGEIAEIFKKVWFKGQKDKLDELKDEIGDLLWYVVRLADSQGWTLEEIMADNIYKLLKRNGGAINLKRVAEER